LRYGLAYAVKLTLGDVAEIADNALLLVESILPERGQVDVALIERNVYRAERWIIRADRLRADLVQVREPYGVTSFGRLRMPSAIAVCTLLAPCVRAAPA
jgi:hypothetical protein